MDLQISENGSYSFSYTSSINEDQYSQAGVKEEIEKEGAGPEDKKENTHK